MLKKLLLIFTLSISVMGQSYNLKGTIGLLSVTMKLDFNEKKIVGSYYYDKYQLPIFLDGLIEGNNLTIREKDGVFKGCFNKQGFKGYWVNNNGKNVEFNLDVKADDEFYNNNYQKSIKGVEVNIDLISYKDNNDIGKLINRYILESISDKKYVNLVGKSNLNIIKIIEIFHEDFVKECYKNSKYNDKPLLWNFEKNFILSYNDLFFSSLYSEGIQFTGGERSYGNLNSILVYKGEKPKVMKLKDILQGDYKSFIKKTLLKKYLFLSENTDNFFEALDEAFYIDESGFNFFYDPMGYGYSQEDIRINYKEIDRKYYNKNSEFFKKVIIPKYGY